MFKSYFKIAVRNLLKNKIYSLINILGFAVGLASCLLILLFVKDELSYDQFHEKRNQIYRLTGLFKQGGDTKNPSAITSYQLGPVLKTAYPQTTFVRLMSAQGLIKYGDKKFQESRGAFADPGLFNLFSFPLVKGSKSEALKHPEAIVIDEEMAARYFGKENPIGKTIDWNGILLQVTGVMKKIPQNSHFHFDFFIAMKAGEKVFPQWILDNWSGTSVHTYLLIPDKKEAQKISASLPSFVKEHLPEGSADYMEYFLQPLEDIHLKSKLNNEWEANGDITYIFIFSGVAFVILLLACINYTNLSIAKSASRAKEVGLRKVVGSRKGPLVIQFLGESILFSFIAMIIGGFMAEFSVPLFNRLAGKELSLTLEDHLQLIGSFFIVSILVGILSGSYPAFFISSFQPIKVLKGKLEGVGWFSLFLRKGLVIFQFTISIALVISTILIFNQLQFLRNKKLGLQTEQIVVLPVPSSNPNNSLEVIKSRLKSSILVKDVTVSSASLTERVGGWRQYKVMGGDVKDAVSLPSLVVDEDFFNTLQCSMRGGRSFSKKYNDVEEAYILNESAVKFLGLKSPVGTPIEGSQFTGSDWSIKKGRIVGVVKDFHFGSLHAKVEPVVFDIYSSRTESPNFMYLRIVGNDLKGAVSFIEGIWKEFEKDRPFTYSFLDKDVYNLYKAEENFLNIFTAFSCLAIFIAALGIFGLASYTVNQRVKEIGVRKVLGASSRQITLLLSKEFLGLILMANIIAWPIAFFSIQSWLDNFPYRIGIGISGFLTASTLAVLVVLITVVYQAFKAAQRNPVIALKYE